MLLGEILLKETTLKPEKLARALEIQAEREGRIGEILLGQKEINDEELAHALATQLGLSYLKKMPEELPIALVENIPINYAKQYRFLPIAVDDHDVTIVTSEPLEIFALDDLRLMFGKSVEVKVCGWNRLLSSINQIYSDAGAMGQDLSKEEFKKEEEDSLDIDQDILEGGLEDDAPVIRFVNNILFRAVKEGASDVHIEPMEKDVVVRFRIDGVLYEVVRIPKRAQSAVTARIKIMGNLNIAEKRLPQDGRIKIKIAGKDIDIRLSTLPTSHGERTVMRLLDRSAVLLAMSQLGFLEGNLEIFAQLISQPHGIILVTGPTGSGKTTTLYSALSKINTPDKNIITVEDPVEYQLPGIGQIPVNRKIDMTFANGLRAILRQDPDVVMIGEIRDHETAEIAIQASLTGHLVFSTVHTNDAASTITRLVDMNIERFLVASSVIGIMAQRLVRLLCKNCKAPHEPTRAELIQMGMTREDLAGLNILGPVGCPTCLNMGYKGRSGIHELLVVNEDIQTMILQAADANEIKREALSNGMMTLRMDGIEKIKRGWTSVEEVMRVTQDEIVALDDE